MKTLNFLNIVFIIWMFFSTGCGDSLTEPQRSDSLYGHWLLKVVSGGIGGIIDTIETSNARWVISFLNENTVVNSYNDSIIFQTNFHIEKRISIYSLDSLRFIIFENNNPPEVITYLNDDTLRLADNYYDGFTKLYVRL